MALADPQTIKISGEEESLPRVNTGNYSSIYENDDGSVKLTLSTVSNRRKRHVYRVDVQKIIEDPYTSTTNVQVSMSTYIVIDRPLVGYSNTEALAVVAGLLEAASASESSDLKKLLGSES